MMVHDGGITESIQKIADHYTTNISTRFLRPMLAGILSDNELAHRISDLTEHSDTQDVQGVHLDELFQQILAMSRFIYLVRTDVLPNLRQLSGTSSSSDANKVYRDMAVNNFGANMKVLTDYVYELYIKAVAYDKSTSGGKGTVFRSMPGLDEIGRYLIDR
jgi:hypothetical protein